MNQGRIWCVVHPTVGLPLLLGSVALTSLAVHTAVMTHTTWMGNYWMGSARIRVTDTATPANAAVAAAGAPFAVTMTSVPGADAQSPASFVITVTPAVAATADGAAKPAPASVSVQAANTQ